MTTENPDDVLTFWFSEAVEAAWFARDEEVDRDIAERFSNTYEMAIKAELDHWQKLPKEALALTIVLDQLPRNLFRGSARSFESDDNALAVAKSALDQGFDQQLSLKERAFFYLPLMHSEDIEEQSRCVELYKTLDNPLALDFAIQHYDIIEKFGRFPHRNNILGRVTTAAEARFLEDHSGF